jgi:DNA primase
MSFFTERTPSFYVHPERGFFCHSCSARGDAITFLMMLDKLSFKDALTRELKRKAS